jgi:hypothetical protein
VPGIRSVAVANLREALDAALAPVAPRTPGPKVTPVAITLEPETPVLG